MAAAAGGMAFAQSMADFGMMQVQAGINAKEAKKQRQWQQLMSSTAYTRAAGDLERAGLNRILALGGPAASGGGAAASASLARSGAGRNPMVDQAQYEKDQAATANLEAGTAKQVQEALESRERTEGQRLLNVDSAAREQYLQSHPKIREMGYGKRDLGYMGAAATGADDVKQFYKENAQGPWRREATKLWKWMNYEDTK